MCRKQLKGKAAIRHILLYVYLNRRLGKQRLSTLQR